MDLRYFQKTIAKDLGARAHEFIPVLIPFSETPGYIHISHAAHFLNSEPLGDDLVMFRNNILIIGQGAQTADEVTGALAQITKLLSKKIPFTPAKELARVGNEWIDEPWDDLKSTTPVCDPKTLRYLGFPIVTSVIAKKIPETDTFVLSRRAEGKGVGSYDHFVSGKNEAHLNGKENAHKEGKEETKIEVIIDDYHPDALTYLSTVRLIEIHDNCVFQREARVYVAKQLDEGEKTAEVDKFISLSSAELINPPDGIRFQGHVLPIAGLVVAHETDNQAYINFANEPIVAKATGTLAQATTYKINPPIAANG